MGKKKKIKKLNNKKVKKLRKSKDKKAENKKANKKAKKRKKKLLKKSNKGLIMQEKGAIILSESKIKTVLPKEKSINYNVKISITKIRALVCEKSLASFIRGDARITVKKAAVIKKRQLAKRDN
jgi:hypothetical protein|tara:strand:- start:1769 stop:2140 length:372 start_codon:yes stop_codon:yes gene_type:complete